MKINPAILALPLLAVIAAGAVLPEIDKYNDKRQLYRSDFDHFRVDHTGKKWGKYTAYFKKGGGQCLGFVNLKYTCDHRPRYDWVHKVFVDELPVRAVQ